MFRSVLKLVIHENNENIFFVVLFGSLLHKVQLFTYRLMDNFLNKSVLTTCWRPATQINQLEN